MRFSKGTYIGFAFALVGSGYACSSSSGPTGDGKTAEESSDISKNAHHAFEPIDQPPPPCHPNPNARADAAHVGERGDVKHLPHDLRGRLMRMAGRPHSQLPTQAYAEADKPSQLFQYFLLDTNGFEPNPFTTRIPGVNDKAMLTVTGGNCGIPTIGSVRMVLEPKPGLPTDPEDVRAFIDVFTDLSNVFVINNESGWYEGWMIYDVDVPDVADPRPDGHAAFGKMTAADQAALMKVGTGNNAKADNTLTMDGNAPRFPSAGDHFPNSQSNLVSLYLSMGAYNALQQTDAHAYWEFNYTTNWVHPLYELPFTGGFPADFGKPPNAFEQGKIGQLSSLIPGSGPAGIKNSPQKYGDSPFLPRDPDKFDADEGFDSQRENRMRFIPSGLAEEIMLDVYARPVSFHPEVQSLEQRLNLAYAEEVARVDQNQDGVISAEEGDVDAASDGFPDNARLFVNAEEWKRFAVTREINDGYLAPRFAPSQRAWVLTGTQVAVSPSVPASEGRDGDDR